MEVDLFTAFVLLVGAGTLATGFVWAIEKIDSQYYGGHKMKRFRDEDGRLTMSIDAIAKETADEARKYYRNGGRYIYQGAAYSLRRFIDRNAHGEIVEVAQFVGVNGKQLFVPPERLGTFLPSVASDGLEITKF